MFINVLPQFIAILLLMGLILAVIDPGTIQHIIGTESGVTGMLISSVLGMVAFVPCFDRVPCCRRAIEQRCRNCPNRGFYFHTHHCRACYPAHGNKVSGEKSSPASQWTCLPVRIYDSLCHRIDINMKKTAKKYGFLAAVIIVSLLTLIFSPQKGAAALCFTGKNFLNFLFMLTPIFICVGLMDVWIDQEIMIKIMGKRSGFKGILVALLLGVVTAVPLYATAAGCRHNAQKRRTYFKRPDFSVCKHKLPYSPAAIRNFFFRLAIYLHKAGAQYHCAFRHRFYYRKNVIRNRQKSDL